MAQPTVKLFDSGVVAAGAVIETPVLDLRGLTELGILVDNAAGNAFRDLVLTSYLEDGTTQVDSVTLRKCGFGAAPDGSLYAPGNVRGYLGPNPPGGTSGVHVMYDKTGAVNTAVDSPDLLTEDLESLWCRVSASGGTTAGYASEVDDSGTAVGLATPAAATSAVGSWVPGATGGTLTLSMPVPRRVRFGGTAAGAGNTVRVRVWGRGRVPGTFAVQMMLPLRAKITLAAAGAANGRLTVIGR